MDNPRLGFNDAVEAPIDPLSVASVVLGIVGIGVFCCGYLLCMWWLAFPVWLIGFILGIVGAVKNQDRNRWIGVAGVALNALPAIAFGIVMMLGIGASLISAASSSH